MYTPKRYREDNFSVLVDFIQKNSFATLVSIDDGKPIAAHIPLLAYPDAEENLWLEGHVARGNPSWRSFADNAQILAIFMGPHTYISSSWYQQPNVPTWNYMAVHIYGKPEIIEGEALYDSLRKLVDKYEQGSENPLNIHTLPSALIEKMMPGIVGFKMKAETMQASFKLSQNRNPEDYHNIIEALRNRTDAASHEVANAMERKM